MLKDHHPRRRLDDTLCRTHPSNLFAGLIRAGGDVMTRAKGSNISSPLSISVSGSVHTTIELHVRINGAEVRDLLEQVLTALMANNPAHNPPQ